MHVTPAIIKDGNIMACGKGFWAALQTLVKNVDKIIMIKIEIPWPIHSSFIF